MKLKNNVLNRVGISLAVAFLAMLVLNLFSNRLGFTIFEVIVSTVIVYIPVTVVWAVISTVKETKPEEESEDVLDD